MGKTRIARLQFQFDRPSSRVGVYLPKSYIFVKASVCDLCSDSNRAVINMTYLTDDSDKPDEIKEYVTFLTLGEDDPSFDSEEMEFIDAFTMKDGIMLYLLRSVQK